MPSVLATLLTEMDDKADERELKRMKSEAELEEKRSKEERNHTERMQSMMMGFMSHMMTMFSGSHVPPAFPTVLKLCAIICSPLSSSVSL